MKQDEKYIVDIQKFMAAIRLDLTRCRECKARRKRV
jgi:hypothetical protein